MPITNPWVVLLKLLSPCPRGVWVHGVNMERATRGLQGAVHWPSQRRRFRGGFSSKPRVLQNLQRKCVKREVCFATDVPGSVARTGCTSLFWRHVWAPDSLLSPEVSACRNRHKRHQEPRNNICRSKWSHYSCQQTFTSFRFPNFCFHSSVNSSPWIGNSSWIFLKPRLSLRSWSQNLRALFEFCEEGKKTAELIWEDEAWIRNWSLGSVTSIILFLRLILLTVIRIK